MKKIILALVLLGISYSGVEAQTKTATVKNACTCPASVKKARSSNTTVTRKSGDTYQVCKEHGGYYTCCVHHKTAKKIVTTKTVATDAAPATAGGTKTVTTKTVVSREVSK
jgi:hypothetical protein